MKKTAKVRTILFLLTLISFLGTAVFAWTSYVQKTQPIMFYSGRIQVEAKLYQLVDPNLDGMDANNTYTEITEQITLNDLIPGQVYSFKIEATNMGNIPGFLKIEMFLESISNNDLKQVIALRYIDQNQEIEKELDDYNLFFQNKQIEEGSSNKEVFYFQIYVTPELGNVMKSASLTIDKFLITLDQIETNG